MIASRRPYEDLSAETLPSFVSGVSADGGGA
jgi:hypothetical protein